VEAACSVLEEEAMTDRDVLLAVPREPLFVGAFARVPVTFGAHSGLGIEDLDFRVRGRRTRDTGGCAVSTSRERDADLAHPEVMLLAGYLPGDYVLTATDRGTGDVVAEAAFAVGLEWPDDSAGPGLWVSGDFRLTGIAGAAWGGGAPTEPENFEVAPAVGVRDVAVLLVDTATQRFDATTSAADVTRWGEIAFTGRTIAGKTVSARDYYKEASYGALDLQGTVHGPASLPGVWADYFLSSGEPLGTFWQACATVGDALIDYTTVDFLVCVVRSVDATAATPRRGVWPWANAIVAKTADGDCPLGMVAIHADGDFAGLVATLCHELGHDLELGGDVYPWPGHTPQVQARQMDGWDIMANQGGLPHPCLVHRMRMGWVPASALKLYNFQHIAGSVNETVTLRPAELPTPPPGKYSGIEVRVAPGWNYYFELRAAQDAQIGDHQLPEEPRILGTDVMYGDDLENLSRRKPVMLLENDADGDGPVLDLGEDYQDQDTSSGIPTDFSVEVESIDDSEARVRVRYGVSSQPDPSIRRWNPPVYKSPDIQVRNARSDADPSWLDVPWENHHNRVVATVRNAGMLNAPGVHVDFSVFDFTAGTSTQPQPVGDDTHDIPALSAVPFTTTWRPAVGGHYCIEARIRHYQTPGANSVIEATEFNNVAQSNYDQFISATSSPGTRERTAVQVENPYTVPLRVHLRTVTSSSPLFRTYLEHTWVVLGPGERRDVGVMFEYAFAEDPVHVPALEAYVGKPLDVSVSALGHVRARPPSEVHVPLGGVSLRVLRGTATRFARFDLDPPVVFGQVVVADGGAPVSTGSVLVTVERGRAQRDLGAPLLSDGRFSLTLDGEWDSVQAYYVPGPGLADASSEVIHNRR
jgi:M6 family metalloprotease-like protein